MTIRERYAVSPVIQASIDRPDFSQVLRDAIARQSESRALQ
jgi:hypothetical protein